MPINISVQVSQIGEQFKRVIKTKVEKLDKAVVEDVVLETDKRALEKKKEEVSRETVGVIENTPINADKTDEEFVSESTAERDLEEEGLSQVDWNIYNLIKRIASILAKVLLVAVVVIVLVSVGLMFFAK